MIALDGEDARDLVRLLEQEAARQAVTVWHDDRDLNLFGIRAANREGDAWDDLIGALWWQRTPARSKGGLIPRLRLFPATTDPGRIYRIQPMTSRGTAILCPGWHRGLWRAGYHHHNRGSYPALVQVAKAPFWRDLDRDAVLDDEASGPQHLEVIGCELHHGGRALQVGRYSAACQVVRFPTHLALILACLAAQERAGHGDTVSYWLSDVRRSPSLAPLLAIPGLEGA